MSVRDFVVVLVGPLYGGNIGSVCRAMANTGMSKLRLVAPDKSVDWSEAERMACHAKGVLDNLQIFDSFADAVGDCSVVAGSTARHGLYRRHAQTPREHAPALCEAAACGRVALVFGREDKGLLNEEVSMCTHLIRIPSDPEYSSLNLAQAVMVVCYEMYVCGGEYETERERSAPAPAALRVRMLDMWRGLLLRIGFMEIKKADHMMSAVNRIFSRGALTMCDVNIMMGVVRQASWALDHDRHNPPDHSTER